MKVWILTEHFPGKTGIEPVIVEVFRTKKAATNARDEEARYSGKYKLSYHIEVQEVQE